MAVMIPNGGGNRQAGIDRQALHTRLGPAVPVKLVSIFAWVVGGAIPCT